MINSFWVSTESCFLLLSSTEHVGNVYALCYTKNKYHLFFIAKFYISLEKTDRMEISALFLSHIKQKG